MDELDSIIRQINEEFGEGTITTANETPRPERALEKQAIDDFMDRNPMAGGGMLVQPSADGSRPGYAKMKEKGVSTEKGGRPIPENIVMADDTKAIKELQNKVDKLNRVNKLDDKGIKFKVTKTQAGNYTTELSYLAKDYRETLGKTKSTGSLNKLTEEFNQFKKTDLFKNYSKSATMKAGGVKSAKKQLADIGSKKLEVFDYLLNNKNATIEQIAKDLKIKDGVVRTSLQGLYTDIYKRTADQGAVYLKDFNSGQLESVHGSIKNTKVRLKDRVKNLVIDAYKGDKNLKPLLEKLDNFYTLQNEIKKTPYGKFFAANLDHPVPLNFIRQLEEGADPFNLIRVRPIPEFLNQRAFKAQFDRVLGTAYKTGNKKALEAIVNVQSYLPQEFGGITPDGKIKDYGAKPFSLKTDLTQSNFGDIYKRVFEFIKNPELQETFKESKVSFKNLASQEKNIMNQVKGLAPFMKNLGIKCQLSNGINCMDPRAYEKSLNELSTKAQAGDQAAAAKMTNFVKSVRGAGSVIKGVLGPAALVFEAGIAVPLGLFEYSQGKPATEIVDSLTYGLFGKSREDRLKEQMPAYGQVENLQNIDQRIQNLERLQKGTRGQKLRSKPKVEKAKEEFQTVAEPFLSLENPAAGMLENLKQSEDLRQKLIEEDLQRKEERKTPFDLSDPFMAAKGGRASFKLGSLRKGIQALIDKSVKSTPKDTTSNLDALIKKALDEDLFDKKDRIVDSINISEAKKRKNYPYNMRVFEEPKNLDFYRAIKESNFRTKTGPFFDRTKKAGGGILKEAGDSSGAPPESGPNSQGLQGLLNRVKKT